VATKIDGTRYFMLAEAKDVYLINRKLQVVRLNFVQAVTLSHVYLVDGELAVTKAGLLFHFLKPFFSKTVERRNCVHHIRCSSCWKVCHAIAFDVKVSLSSLYCSLSY
jgi:hypothetical protein